MKDNRKWQGIIMTCLVIRTPDQTTVQPPLQASHDALSYCKYGRFRIQFVGATRCHSEFEYIQYSYTYSNQAQIKPSLIDIHPCEVEVRILIVKGIFIDVGYEQDIIMTA